MSSLPSIVESLGGLGAVFGRESRFKGLWHASLHGPEIAGNRQRECEKVKTRDALERAAGGRVVILLMGVSGAGKTTVGRLLASELGWDFADGDVYHSAANVEKMSKGIPLTDADRESWLETLRALIVGWIAAGQNAALACSALKRVYRERLIVGPEVQVVYLKGSVQVLHQRLRARRGHFMTEQMLDSQLTTLEEPKQVIVIDVDRSPMEIVAEIRAALKLTRQN